ncbi:hypothetical protein [Micromonospora sp. NBC_01638]|uniref:hypothetical protein n=1 Tax=Micromonospora sp. NBC_01638 TaxID=2975982 RepID=UPI0038643593|nr:hypothetical protein OG811_29680 [Micromonospora sp. NBC_01638]
MVTLVVVTPATPAVIGKAGGQVIVGDGEGVGVVEGVASVVPLVPPQTASAMVVTARNMRSIGTSGGYRAPLTEVVAGAALGFPATDEDRPARVA